MITYKELLEKSGIISEKEFNDVIKIIPEFDCSNIELDSDEIDSKYNLCIALMGEFISSCTTYAWINDLSFDNLSLKVWDIESYEELDNIESKLNSLGWKITNRDDIIEDLNDNLENTDDDLKYDWSSSLRKEILNKISNLPLDKLKELNEKL